MSLLTATKHHDPEGLPSVMSGFDVSYHVGPTLTPERVGRGVVYVLARWSPEAVDRFDELSLELTRSGYSGKLIVVDLADTTLDVIAFGRCFGLAIHGWGEAFAVDGGRVVARSSMEEGSTLAALARAMDRA